MSSAFEQSQTGQEGAGGGAAQPANGAAPSNGASADSSASSVRGEDRKTQQQRRSVRQRQQRWGKKQRRIRERLSAYREARREERPPRQPPRVAVPSFFTLMNLFSGFLALTQVHGGEFERACWLIVLAGFFDVLDGLTARLADAQSPFGVELDSLSDVVSFGVAPAYLVYVFGLSEFGPLGLIVAALPALCGAVRLARFNVRSDGEKKDHFEGLPIPAQAVTLVALILTLERAAWFTRGSDGNLTVLIPVVFVLAFLMISTIRFDAFPKPTLTYIRAHPRKSALYALAVLLLPLLQEIGLLILLTGYLLHGIVDTGRRVYHAVMSAPLE